MLYFSQNFVEAVRKSMALCRQENANQISPRHLLLAMEGTKGCLAYDILAQLKPLTKPKKSPPTANDSAIPDFDKDAGKAIERAASLAYQHRHHYIGTEHLLAALMELPADKISRTALPMEKIKKHLHTVFKSSSNLPDFSKIFQANLGKTSVGLGDEPQLSALEYFSVDLTKNENQKNVNPIIGREAEIERLIQILCRKDKNNPVILGEAGVGKTALVEGLAKKITEKSIPLILADKRILSLDLGLIVAGTMYRGEFENRLKTIIDEVSRDPNVILFIDELHNIIGAGSASGSMDAANLLKPLLSRGKLRCIGATTPDEYKKHIEPDPALDRRFQALYLSEPSAAETLEILQGIKNNYQNFHQVHFTDEALAAAVNLSVRYIQDKLLPDKAIDLIDEAAAKVKIRHQAKSPLLEQRHKLENELRLIEKEKDKAVLAEDYNLAIKQKSKEKELSAALDKVKSELEQELTKNKILVTDAEILSLLSQKTGIPINELTEAEYQKLNLITKQLKDIIVGQDSTIDQIMKAISYARLGLSDETRPLASFLLLGPSGVGKTFFAREAAKLLYKNPESFIQLDMSEFHEKFQATKLIGAPAGYIGYREGNKFTDLVKKNPHCLILLDEIEKAHPDVLDLLLQILEHGQLTDSVGKKVNFKNSIIIMTANVLSDKFSRKALGFGKEETVDLDVSKHLPELKKQFKPELINRINNIIIFNSLSAKELEKIIINQIRSLTNKLAANGISLVCRAGVAALLADKAAQLGSGARAIQTIIKQEVEQPLLDKILAGKTKSFLVQKTKNTLIIK